MFHTILVPVDLTPKNRQAVEAALNIAKAYDGRVILLHVIEQIADTTRDGELKDFYDHLETQAETELQTLLHKYQPQIQAMERVIVFGNRVEEILRFAEEEDVDLIVMTSHAIDPEEPGRSWGTVSYKIALLARCPVMLVK
jgi:universal stress protein A